MENNIKRPLLLLVLLATLTFFAEAQNSGSIFKVGPYIEFAEAEYDFKDIVQGESVEHTFEFVNSGTHPLILSNVVVTCGCTATQWPREPLIPGDSSRITVKFDSTGKVGRQNKVITIMSNAVNNQEKIKIVANVLPGNSVN